MYARFSWSLFVMVSALMGCRASERETDEETDSHYHDHDTADDTGQGEVDWDEARTLPTSGGSFDVSVVIEPDPTFIGVETDIDILAIYADDPDTHLHEVTLTILLEHPSSGATRDDVSHRDRGHGDYRVRELVLDEDGVWTLNLTLTESGVDESVSFDLYVQP